MGLNPLIRRILEGAGFKTWQQLEAEHQAHQPSIRFNFRPRIVKDGSSYRCSGAGASGYGVTPKRAYDAWVRYMAGMQNYNSLAKIISNPLCNPDTR